MLDPDLLDYLRSDAGSRLLHAAAALEGDPFAAQKLRSHATFEQAAAAVDQVKLRRSARSKFAEADRMWFSQALLEQASGAAIARYRAGRYGAWKRVGDCCCGLGGDALALARDGEVVAVDRNPLALALTRANAEVMGVADRLTLLEADVTSPTLPAVGAGWIDPGRRETGKRTRSLTAMSPGMSEILALRERVPHLGIKLSPASPDEELDHWLTGIPHEREVISLGGECKELVVWTGDLAGGVPRSATLLPGGDRLTGVPIPTPAAGPPTGYLMEPDGAVIRGGLVGNLARELRAHPLDDALAYLWLPRPQVSPFGRVYTVGDPEPFSLRGLSDRLRALQASDVVLKTRGFAADPAALRQELRRVLKQGLPGRCPVVFITRVRERPVMLVGERFGPTDTE